MASFRFRSLESASHFRILYLDASADDEQLSGSLVHHNLDQHPIYNCLSYVWGCPTLSHSVLVDGYPFPVTANLYSALKRIRARRSNGRIPIWADGICINQDDIPERSQQVNLMRRIYSECQTGLMYLGEAADGSDLLPDFLVTLALSMKASMGKADKPAMHDFENIIAFPEDTHPGWRSLKAFLRRPWFRRVWIVQEFALPPQIRMICGEWEISGALLALLFVSPTWKYSQKALTNFIDKETRAAFTSHRVHLEVRLAAGRDKLLHSDSYSKKPSTVRIQRRNQSLIWLLDYSKLFLATDPRDRIFALIPLSSDSKNMDLTVDYSKNMEIVTREIAQHFLRNGYGLSLLLGASESGSSTDSASWYPNWMDSGVSLKHCIWPMRYERIPDCQIMPNPSTQAITVIGSIVDIVQDKGVLVDKEHILNEKAKWIKEIDTLAARIQVYPTEQSVEEAIWRTLIGDRTLAMQSPAPDSYGDFYRESRNANAIFDRGIRSLEKLREVTDRMACYEAAISRGYRFSTTPRKLFSMLPEEAEVGDSIFFVKGDPEKATFLIRKDPVLDQHRLIGQAYVHGIWDVLKMDDLEDKVISIY